jgi:uncharacterized protein
MSTYLSPGVYVEEIPSGSKPIEGVSTSTAAFVGVAPRGPANAAVLIGSLDDYKQRFGEIASAADTMGLALQAFYLNGGRSAYVCRIVADDADAASATARDTTPADALTLTAKNPGAWGNVIHYTITVGTGTFTLNLGHRDAEGDFVVDESFAGLSMSTASDAYAGTIVTERSRLVDLAVLGSDLPAATTDDAGVPLTGGDDGTAPTADDFSDFYSQTLRKVRDVSIMVVPGESWAADGSGNAILSATLSHCETMRNRVLIVDPPEGLELDQAATVATMALPTSTYSVLYYPWIAVASPEYHAELNPNVGRTVDVAPSAFAAGMWARIDSRRGVWKAPAGVETNLLGVAGLEFKVETTEQDQLNPLGVNCIRTLPNYGNVIWGSRTLATRAAPEWRYVPVRRTAIMIEQSIYHGIQWAVFEPNDHPLWSSLRANIGGFMNGLFRAGAFQGATAKQAYFVRCGLGDTMTQADIDRGQVIVIVGFAPLKPAEFVIVRIQQKVGEQ